MVKQQSKQTRKIDVILFDLDDTLVNTTIASIKLYNEVLQQVNLPNLNKKQISFMQKSSPQKLLSKIIVEKEKQETAVSLREETTERVSEMEVSEGVIETLDLLTKKSIKRGVVTSRDKESSIEILKHFGLYSYFKECIITRCDCKNLKPHPEPLHKALSKLGITDKSRVVYIGDSPSDFEVAKNGGIKFIGFGKTTNSKRYITKYKELPTAINELNISIN